MPIYSVVYHYGPDTEVRMANRPAHREFIAQHFNPGPFLAAGVLGDKPQALLVLRAESRDELVTFLDQDPYASIPGVIESRVIDEWNPAFGPWTDAD